MPAASRFWARAVLSAAVNSGFSYRTSSSLSHRVKSVSYTHLTLDKAAKALDALHVEEIEALGKPFDPNFMNAVQQIPAPDGQESGTVIRCV